MTVAYIECAAGASGDMFLGAFLNLGVSESELRTKLGGLSVTEYELTVERVVKRGITATKANVKAGHSHHHRHLPDIVKIIESSDLPAIVKEKSKEAFWHLAVAEAEVHGTTTDKIHFHEVGAVDAIVDIVGAMICWNLLGEPECVVTPIEVGGGTVECQHGVMPVPAPATARLLTGFPTYSTGTWGETTTPTGAAIIRTLAKPVHEAGNRPFVSQGIGYGAGSKDFPFANVIRIQLGEWVGSTSSTSMPTVPAVVIEANVDDMSAELAGYAIESLLAAGAMDVTWTPIVMKKSRPAMQLQVLCSPENVLRLQQEIIRQTTTIGLRTYQVDKVELPRETREVDTPYGSIAVKFAKLGDEIINAAPEYESCRLRAEAVGVPLKVVYQAAVASAAQYKQ